MTDYPEQPPEDLYTGAFLAEVALDGIDPGTYQPPPGHLLVDADAMVSIQLDEDTKEQ
ncbi:hypothetical protein AB0G79_20145 [Streptomyces sp. NPDC020807]|uniref:hypothetical protein n=1 Tax=Streptomyces sp. NPDC020807 TaxID=3155119 RepID=UPI0033C06391